MSAILLARMTAKPSKARSLANRRQGQHLNKMLARSAFQTLACPVSNKGPATGDRAWKRRTLSPSTPSTRWLRCKGWTKISSNLYYHCASSKNSAKISWIEVCLCSTSNTAMGTSIFRGGFSISCMRLTVSWQVIGHGRWRMAMVIGKRNISKHSWSQPLKKRKKVWNSKHSMKKRTYWSLNSMRKAMIARILKCLKGTI